MRIWTVGLLLLLTSISRAGEYKNIYTCNVILSIAYNNLVTPRASFATASIEYAVGLSVQPELYDEIFGGRLSAHVFTMVQEEYAYSSFLVIERDGVPVYRTPVLAGDFLNTGFFDEYQIDFTCNKGAAVVNRY